MRGVYVVIISVVFSHCYSQNNNTIDVGLRGDYSYQFDGAIGPTVGWSDGRHQLGVFWRSYLFGFGSINNNGVGVFYKIFPNKRSRSFNLFYQGGSEYYFKGDSFDHSVFDYTLNTQIPLSTTNRDTHFAYYVGLGFEMKLIDAFRLQISGHLMHSYYSFESISTQYPDMVEYSRYSSKNWQFMPYVSCDLIYRISLVKKTKGQPEPSLNMSSN